jgi:hypothetical protein
MTVVFANVCDAIARLAAPTVNLIPREATNNRFNRCRGPRGF